MKQRNMAIPTITIHMGKKCAECGKEGAAENGLCMGCTSKAIRGKFMKSPAGRAVARKFNELKNKHR